ncbi:hypothetical protein C8T65DRAFT_745386 [Cerioporus squamosus]|nr:hypothetical protein C8T65DRAFT_745386 [Cerioporus squamosus]
MGPYGQFCLDYDIERRAPINLPKGHCLHPTAVPAPAAPGPGHPPAGYPVPVNAPHFGMGELEGEERRSIPQGTYVTLRRVGHLDFLFQMPTRQPALVVAQP